MKIFNKIPFGHRVGNVIQSLVSIAENLIIILTFSSIRPSWSFDFVIWRLKTPNWLYKRCEN